MNPENIRGIDVSYALICDRRLWLSLHGDIIKDGTEYIYEGKYLNDKKRKYGLSQLRIGSNVLDYVKISDSKYVIHEFKRGKRLLDADIYQISHYMYILKRLLKIDVEGYIHLLGSKKVIKINLNNDLINNLNKLYQKIEKMKLTEIPQPIKNSFCFSGCSFVEFCWGNV